MIKTRDRSPRADRSFQSTRRISPKKERKESNNKIDRHGRTIDRFQLTSVGRWLDAKAPWEASHNRCLKQDTHTVSPSALPSSLFPANDSLINREPRVPQAETTLWVRASFPSRPRENKTRSSVATVRITFTRTFAAIVLGSAGNGLCPREESRLVEPWQRRNAKARREIFTSLDLNFFYFFFTSSKILPTSFDFVLEENVSVILLNFIVKF